MGHQPEGCWAFWKGREILVKEWTSRPIKGGGDIKGQIEGNLWKSCGLGSKVTHCLFRIGSGKRLYPNGLSDANPDAKTFETLWGGKKVMKLGI